MEEQTISLDDAVEMVTTHMRNKNYRVAELILQDILKAVPDYADAHYMLGLARYYLGDIENALGHIKDAVANEDEAQAEWWCNYGILLTESKRFDEALPAFDKAIGLDADYAESYWNKAHSHWLAGQYEEAEASARKGIEMKPDSPEAWLNLGTALVKLEKKDEAVEAWEKALALNSEFVFAWNNLGNVLREMGQLEASAEKCRKALELDPDYPQAQNNLANALMDLGDLQESEEYYRKAIATKPDYAEAHNNLAINLVKQSRFAEAIQAARVALSYRKDYVESLLALSFAYRAVGSIDEAEQTIQQAVLLKPDSAEVRIDLADVLFMKDRYADAEVELERARQLEPESPRVYLRLAEVLERGNKPEEALEAVDKAVELNPEMLEAYLKKGSICHVANRAEEAEEYFKKTLEMKPDSAMALLSMSELLLSKGEKENALEHIKEAQAIAENIPSLYFTLSKVKKFTEDDADFQKMVELEKSADSFGIDQASMLSYALYSAYENIGDTDKAFEHLIKANRYKRRLVPYDAERQRELYKAIPEKYTKDVLKSLEGKGFESELPVFILGMPRSGTTLTEQIISSHADVFGAGELLEIGALEVKFGNFGEDTVKAEGEWYVEEVRKKDPDGTALRITDKMPGNFSSLGRIASILPQAKIIHTRRNPIDTCLSCFKQNFARGQYWSYDLKELGEYCNDYVELMAYWRDVLGDRFIEIDYEDTVGEFEKQARNLIDYVDLPWDDACLQPHKQKRTVLTASKMQVIKPVYKTSVKSWKKYEKQLAPLIDELSSGAAKALLDD